MIEKVKNILMDITDVARDDLILSSTLMGDLSLNSIDIANLIVRIEDEFDIEISDLMIIKIQTLDDIIKAIESKDI